MHTAHINIGSNIGDRMLNIRAAVAAICATIDAGAAVSDPVESDPWGFQSPNRFVNIGVTVHTDLEPLPLLRALRGIERSLCPDPHRDSDGRYIDRAIDIDLIFVDDIVIDSPELTLPHPRLHERPFVLTPLLQLHPGWKSPRSAAPVPPQRP